MGGEPIRLSARQKHLLLWLRVDNQHIWHSCKIPAVNFPAKTGLLVGQAIISIKSFKSGIARFFSLLKAAEKVGKGFIQSIGNILKHLGIDFIKGRSLFCSFP